MKASLTLNSGYRHSKIWLVFISWCGDVRTFIRVFKFMHNVSDFQTFNFPWKKAFCEFSLPLMRSTRSESLMISVTSGLAETRLLLALFLLMLSQVESFLLKLSHVESSWVIFAQVESCWVLDTQRDVRLGWNTIIFSIVYRNQLEAVRRIILME